MDNLNKSPSFLNADLRTLPRYFQKRRSAWRRNQDFDKYLMIIALVSFVSGMALLLISGLQTAFWPAHHLARSLLSEALWANITFLGDTYTALAIALLFSQRFPHITIAILGSALVCTLLIHGFKHVLTTPRPPALLLEAGLDVIGPHYKRSSMPSGHTATAFVLATLLTRCIQTHWKKVAIIVAAGFVAWSRVACGVHWLTDVLVGAAIGIASGLIGMRIADVVKLSTPFYLFVCVLLCYAAITLFQYDGDLPHTATTAQIIGFTALFYWINTWLFEFAKPLLKQIWEREF